ncbi:MAG: hybrid sensor histidine kinase/response regulator, partial [Steroidobacter sp.]
MQWLSGGGIMGDRIRAKDWSATALGPIENWPPSLRTALGICLEFPAPSCIVWGRRRTQIYNDAYAALPAILQAPERALGEDFAQS